jgi:hypothetical protein
MEHQQLLQRSEAGARRLQSQLQQGEVREQLLERQLLQARAEAHEELQRLVGALQGKASENAAMREGLSLLMELLQEQGPLARRARSRPRQGTSASAPTAPWRPGGAGPAGPASPRLQDAFRGRAFGR